jgi:peroxiredoxin
VGADCSSHSKFFGVVKQMSKLITPGELAPDFELEDVNGKLVRLSDFRGSKPVVLAFLRGFM